MRLSNMFQEYIAHLQIYNTIGTVEFTKAHTKQLLEYFGAYCDHTEIDEKMVITYIESLKSRNLSHNTINKHVQLLKRVYRHHGFDMKFGKVRKLKEKFVTYGVLDNDALQEILALVEKMSLRDRVIFYLFIDTGCRLSELLNIKVENINFETRSIYLEHTKTNQVRTVFFTKKTRVQLLRFCKSVTHEFLFTNPKTNHKLTVSAYERIFYRFRQKYGIKKLSPHMLRHTFSTQLYNNGADLVFISRVLGHSSVETTKRYIHQDNAKNLKNYDKYMRKEVN